jgi:protein SCO1/2
MKIKTLLLTCTVLAANALRATEPAPPPCCPAPEVKPAGAACCVEEKPAAPLTARSIYQLDAKWTNDAGESVRLAGLRGKPVVLAMFFAQCEYACPVLVHDIKRLRAALPAQMRDETQFVLVSFDVARDTPAALKAYRERADLDQNWTLLRGDANAVQELAMLLGVKFKQDSRGQFSHSNLFTVLNRGGEVVHQHAGLKGDISEAAKAVTLAAK